MWEMINLPSGRAAVINRHRLGDPVRRVKFRGGWSEENFVIYQAMPVQSDAETALRELSHT